MRMAAETAEQREARLQRVRDQRRSRRAVETAVVLHACIAVRLRELEHHAWTIVGGWWTQRLCNYDTGADLSKLTLIKAQFSALNRLPRRKWDIG